MFFRLFSISDDLWGIKFKSLILRQKIPRTMFSVFFYPSRRFGISSPKVYLICRRLHHIFAESHPKSDDSEPLSQSRDPGSSCLYHEQVRFESETPLCQRLPYFHTQKRRLFAAAAFFYVPSDIIYVQSDHTYIVKNFGSSESRFAADA